VTNLSEQKQTQHETQNKTLRTFNMLILNTVIINVNFSNVQSKNVVNNVDMSSSRAP